MKKKVIFFIIILIMIFIALVIKQSLIKDYENLEGFLATSRRVSLTVSPFPVISIISPENTTYSTNTILLDYSITNEADSIWYNLDNGINITINSPLQFTTTEGSHILYLYAGNIYRNSTKNISFFVDLSVEPTQPPSGGSGGWGGDGGIIGNKTQQQKDNLTTAEETSANNTEQETPKDITENPEIEPRNTKGIIIKFLISLLFLILLILLVISLIVIIKRKRDRKNRKKKK